MSEQAVMSVDCREKGGLEMKHRDRTQNVHDNVRSMGLREGRDKHNGTMHGNNA